jgi:glycopeptide antibiotics resistance protein
MTIPVFFRCLITLAFVALIVILSVTPDRSETGDSIFVWLVATTPSLLQKILHVTCYAVLTFLFAWTLEKFGSTLSRLGLSFIFAIGLGIALEWYQTMVPGRFGTLGDVLLNGLGALAGLVLAGLLL